MGPESLRAGQIVAKRYRLDRVLGHGGMGTVWAATHTVTRKEVALKFVRRRSGEAKNTEARQRILREARAASAVKHPNVVVVHDVTETEDGAPLMVMELLAGESLAQKLKRDGALGLGEVARILVPVIDALAAAHGVGIVHRDLKPDNVFLAGERVKVLDFGIAKLTATEGSAVETAGLTGTGAMLGTPFYMAPEQAFGEKDIDARADVWALGVVLYECLAGVRPTQADNLGQILKIITTNAIRPLESHLPDLPADVVALAKRLLSPAREDRPATVDEARAVLAAHAASAPTPEEQPRTAVSEAPMATARAPFLPLAAAGAAIVLGGALAWRAFATAPVAADSASAPDAPALTSSSSRSPSPPPTIAAVSAPVPLPALPTAAVRTAPSLPSTPAVVPDKPHAPPPTPSASAPASSAGPGNVILTPPF